MARIGQDAARTLSKPCFDSSGSLVHNADLFRPAPLQPRCINRNPLTNKWTGNCVDLHVRFGFELRSVSNRKARLAVRLREAPGRFTGTRVCLAFYESSCCIGAKSRAGGGDIGRETTPFHGETRYHRVTSTT